MVSVDVFVRLSVTLAVEANIDSARKKITCSQISPIDEHDLHRRLLLKISEWSKDVSRDNSKTGRRRLSWSSIKLSNNVNHHDECIRCVIYLKFSSNMEVCRFVTRGRSMLYKHLQYEQTCNEKLWYRLFQSSINILLQSCQTHEDGWNRFHYHASTFPLYSGISGWRQHAE